MIQPSVRRDSAMEWMRWHFFVAYFFGGAGAGGLVMALMLSRAFGQLYSGH
jgi:hypothetical protein